MTYLNVSLNERLCNKILAKDNFIICRPIATDTRYHQSQIFFSKDENDDKFIKFYICKAFGKWRIDYTYDKNIKECYKMNTIVNMKTQKELLSKIDELLLVA